MGDAFEPRSLLDQTLADRAVAGPRKQRAFIYARRSYDPNGIARAIGDQTSEGRRTCEHNDWIVAGEFADPDNSASRHSRKDRPDYDDMVKRVEAGECEVIVSWESVRLSRDITVFTRLADLCERTGVLLCLNGVTYNMGNSQQRFFAQMTVLQGGYEADTMRDRALRPMAALAREGRPTGSTPYGFAREYDPTTGVLLRQYPDEESAAVVAELTRRVAGGESLLSLARDMNGRGIPAPREGGEWIPMSVRKVVSRATNLGKRVHQGRVVGDAAWAAIVPEADYYAALKVLSDPARRTQKDTAVKYLMSGISFCPQGHKLYVQGGSKQVHRRYLCRTCFSVAVPVAVLDDLVTATVLTYVERPEFAAALMPGDADGQAREALALAAQLEGELERARALVGTVANGRLALSVADFAVISAQLTQQIDAARDRAQEATVPVVLRRFTGAGARGVWEASTLMERRALVRELVRVTLNPVGAGVRTVRPGRVSWDWQW
jgi:DNA invertase Pin-like site-specific DNA recombinase